MTGQRMTWVQTPCPGAHHGQQGRPDCPAMLRHHHDDKCRPELETIIDEQQRRLRAAEAERDAAAKALDLARGALHAQLHAQRMQIGNPYGDVTLSVIAGRALRCEFGVSEAEIHGRMNEPECPHCGAQLAEGRA